MAESARSNKMPALWVSVLAEFIGTFLFQLLGGSERTGLHNGVVLTVLIYMTGREAHSTLSCPFPHSPDTRLCAAEASGGVLNPAVATGLLVAGEMDRRKWVFYVMAEVIGAVFGALLAGGIEEKCFLPKENPEMTCLADFSHSNTGPGCAPDIQPDAYFRVFVWESVGTFILVSTVFATAIAKPGFGDAHARPYPVATF